MAVIQIGRTTVLNIRDFIGLSSDAKPTNCDAGSTFIETDTLIESLHDGTGWKPKNVKTFSFHNAINSPDQGLILTVGAFKTLKISIYGTATTRTVQFFEKNENGDLVPLLGFNNSTADLVTSTNGTTSESWVFDITGLNQIVMNVSAVSGGNLTIIGTVVG